MSISAGSMANTYVFRAVKNNGPMVDETIKSVNFPNNESPVTFIVSIAAVFGDKFKMQITNTDGGSDATLNSIITVIQ